MKYTVRFAHLKELSNHNIGDEIKRGDIVGVMGNTGASEAAHLHIDVIRGYVKKIIRLHEIGEDKEFKPDIKQLNYFIDNELFNYSFFITSYYYDPLYGKDHPAYDIVPTDRHDTDKHHTFYWNRSAEGIVLATGNDRGYGNYILIGFET